MLTAFVRGIPCGFNLNYASHTSDRLNRPSSTFLTILEVERYLYAAIFPEFRQIHNLGGSTGSLCAGMTRSHELLGVAKVSEPEESNHTDTASVQTGDRLGTSFSNTRPVSLVCS